LPAARIAAMSTIMPRRFNAQRTCHLSPQRKTQLENLSARSALFEAASLDHSCI
jgi:hypothetical protein